jgi:hypothetical protein
MYSPFLGRMFSFGIAIVSIFRFPPDRRRGHHHDFGLSAHVREGRPLSTLWATKLRQLLTTSPGAHRGYLCRNSIDFGGSFPTSIRGTLEICVSTRYGQSCATGTYHDSALSLVYNEVARIGLFAQVTACSKRVRTVSTMSW